MTTSENQNEQSEQRILSGEEFQQAVNDAIEALGDGTSIPEENFQIYPDPFEGTILSQQRQEEIQQVLQDLRTTSIVFNSEPIAQYTATANTGYINGIDPTSSATTAIYSTSEPEGQRSDEEIEEELVAVSVNSNRRTSDQADRQSEIEVFNDSYQDAVWAKNNFSVVVGGIGGIGSWTALLLSRISNNIAIYDMDTIEQRNISGQFFSPYQTSTKKTEAISKIMKTFSMVEPCFIGNRFDENEEIESFIAIACFDNMASRKLMLEKWLEYVAEHKADMAGYSDEKMAKKIPYLFIDARMTAESGIIFAIKSPKDVELYLKYEMFDDSEVDEEPCNYRSTSHNGAMIASLIIQLIVNHVSNKEYGFYLREVPFKIEYQTPLFMFQTQTTKEYEASKCNGG